MYRIEALARHHVRSDFVCGKSELDKYIRETATQDVRRNVASVFITVRDGTAEVAGYYALSSYSVLLNDLPPPFQKKLPRYPSIPVALLGRLAVSVNHQGRRLGEYLLVDALRRVVTVTHEVAATAVVVDALDDEAKAFYQRYDVQTFANEPRRLYLEMGTVRQLVFASGSKQV